ncbi:hypothetical protein EMCG_02745 [[Emmonsia] crescens]|uniref:Uncharacterized protein n=1 Tax=[Emmonsia] crescens TaxID=73230 RepID=A0A0G2HYM4_9EURO|nr:hypothetical protein EMCG_02745 [Emmonsia crescens UAMH 3008]
MKGESAAFGLYGWLSSWAQLCGDDEQHDSGSVNNYTLDPLCSSKTGCCMVLRHRLPIASESLSLYKDDSGNEPEQTLKVSGPDTLKYDTEFVDLSTHLGMQLMVQFYKDSWKMYNENQAPRAKADAYKPHRRPRLSNDRSLPWTAHLD